MKSIYSHLSRNLSCLAIIIILIWCICYWMEARLPIFWDQCDDWKYKKKCIGSVTTGKVRTPTLDSSGTGAIRDAMRFRKYPQVTHFIQERSSGWLMWVIKWYFNFAIFTYNTVRCEQDFRNQTRCFILILCRSMKNILFYQLSRGWRTNKKRRDPLHLRKTK